MIENTGLKLNHLGIAVSNIKKALPVYQDLFAYKLIGDIYKDQTQKVNVCFVGSGKEGEVIFELVEPTAKDSPVNQWLSKGVSIYHIGYDTDNIDATLEEVHSQGCIIVSRPVPAVAFSGRKVAWLYTPTRQLIEIVER